MIPMTDNVIRRMRREPSFMHACTERQRQLLMRIQQLQNARQSGVITIEIQAGRLCWREGDARDVEIMEGG